MQKVLLELGTARTSNTLTVPAQEHFLRQARPAAPDADEKTGLNKKARARADYVRVTVALTVAAADVAEALAIAWDAFRGAARDDLTGWEVTAAAAEVQSQPPLTGASGHH
jgi:hypothetical protein